MHILAINELLHLTQAELCGRGAQAVTSLMESPESSETRARAFINLRNIRRVLAWRELEPQ